MAHAATKSARIEACLDAEYGALGACIDLLERERQILSEGAIESLEQMSAEKSALLAAMNQRSSEREQALAACGIAAGKAGLDAFLHAYPQFQPHWKNIAESARRARELNAQNGSMIHARLNHTRQALAILAGPQAPAAMYGRDGQVRQTAAARPLGTA